MQEMNGLKITWEAKNPAPLYSKYDCKDEDQPAYVVLRCKEREVDVWVNDDLNARMTQNDGLGLAWFQEANQEIWLPINNMLDEDQIIEVLREYFQCMVDIVDLEYYSDEQLKQAEDLAQWIWQWSPSEYKIHDAEFVFDSYRELRERVEKNYRFSGKIEVDPDEILDAVIKDVEDENNITVVNKNAARQNVVDIIAELVQGE